MTSFARVLLIIAAAVAPATAAVAQTERYPAFCQGIAVDGTVNRMFVSRTFGYPQSRPPTGDILSEGSAGAEFAREVKRRANVSLVDYSCYTRPTADEIDALAKQTVETNRASWTVDVIDWAPKGATPVGTAVAAEPGTASTPMPSSRSGATSSPDSARQAAAERAAAERAAAAERLAEERAAAAREAAEQVRSLNAAQAATAAAQAQKIIADKKAFQDQRAAYERANKANIDQQAAYVSARAKYEADVRAAEEAQRQWEADVAACKKGDSRRCAPR